MQINPEEVNAAFTASLYTESELTKPRDAVVVRGVTGTYTFHPERLESYREAVTRWVYALPAYFQADKGGGGSFVNACYDSQNVQWTSLQAQVEQLFCLGMGLRLVTCPVPRDAWRWLPGGVPYYTIVSQDGGTARTSKPHLSKIKYET